MKQGIFKRIIVFLVAGRGIIPRPKPNGTTEY
jgi:hypothetical protein